MYLNKISNAGGGIVARPYVSPAVEVVGVELQNCVMAGSDVATENLAYDDFEW